ncbi:hypothetical protein AX774_g4212 [Zancudomyces culisetae]|uniref:Uncharacterized protein n=1 Tax=Zancudomyces culisetae TaxID=1213189 RepID=A0A1R1PN36_ZANCU|nr:hypothetical protein AX774_g4425 [Zancudomyces culisetae]OMH82312.1 hypothetical protein AX774_g4212 [Zancudomyces culisetae]|eukprot:OMH82109.1 hypothetical protein AX774_g4425 [Zancudomyces culisetae]
MAEEFVSNLFKGLENVSLIVGRKGVGKSKAVQGIFGKSLEYTDENVQVSSNRLFSLKYRPIQWEHKTVYYEFKTHIWVHETGKNDSFLSSSSVDRARLGGPIDAIVFIFDAFQPDSFKEFEFWSNFASVNNIGLRLCVNNPTKPAKILNLLGFQKTHNYGNICVSKGWEYVDLSKMYESNSLTFPSTKLVIKPDQVDPHVGYNNYLHVLLAFEQHFWSYMYSVRRYDAPGQTGLEAGIRVTPDLLGSWVRNDAIAKMNFGIFGITSQRLASYLCCDGEIDYTLYDSDWEKVVAALDEKEIFKLTAQLFPEVECSTVVETPMESIENVIYKLKKIHKKLQLLPLTERRLQAAKVAVAYSSQLA